MWVPSERRVGVSAISRSAPSLDGVAASAAFWPPGAAFQGTSPRTLT